MLVLELCFFLRYMFYSLILLQLWGGGAYVCIYIYMCTYICNVSKDINTCISELWDNAVCFTQIWDSSFKNLRKLFLDILNLKSYAPICSHMHLLCNPPSSRNLWIQSERTRFSEKLSVKDFNLESSIQW